MYKILNEVKEVLKQRALNDYGPGRPMFDKIGIFWTKYIGDIISPRDVTIMMALFKIAHKSRTSKRDNLLDAIGYLVLASELKD